MVGALWTPVMDVSVTMQLKFQQTFRSKNVEVPQIPFIDIGGLLLLPVVLQ